MAGLVPFNKKAPGLFNTGYGDFYNMLEDFFSDNWPIKRSLSLDTFKIDVQENEQEYLIDAELPGTNKEDVNIEMNEGKLNISVQREDCSENENKNYIHKERRYCSMSRSIYLADARKDDIKARLENGILSIVIPKVDKAANIVKIDVE